MENWFSFVFIGYSLSESDPYEPWVHLLPITSIPVIWDSYCCKGLLSLRMHAVVWSISSFCVLFWIFCTSISALFFVASAFSTSSSKGSVHCQPFGFLHCFLFRLGSSLACGQALWRWPVCKHPRHRKAIFSWSNGWVHCILLKINIIQSSSLWLRSNSTHTLVKVNIPLVSLSASIFRKFTREFPIPYKTLWCQKCNGWLCNLTQTSIFDTNIVLASKSGNQGVMKSPTLPQNHGPLLRIYSFSWTVLNLTIKNPLEHKWISQLQN